MSTVVSTRSGRDPRFGMVAIPFLTSGFAALTYQVCWQRLLFAAFGADIESITIIVSSFMLGLGVGAHVGGQLADAFPRRIVALFAGAELAIGLFGLASPLLIAWVAQLTLQAAPATVAVANFALILLPTTLMGATLPMLVAFLVQKSANVGVSIGGLYFINTLGAAIGAAAVGLVLLHHLDLVETIYFAAALNFFAAALLVWQSRRERA